MAAQHGFRIDNPELQKGIQAQRDLLHQARQQQAAAQQAGKAVQQPVVEQDVPPVVSPIERDRGRGGFERG